MKNTAEAINLVKQLPIPDYEKPGVMLYHDDWTDLQDVYTTDEIGGLFVAALEYDRDGTIPQDFNDKGLQLRFSTIQKKIDRDRWDYIASVWKGHYMTAKRGGKTSLSFEEWLSHKVSQGQQDETVNMIERSYMQDLRDAMKNRSF